MAERLPLVLDGASFEELPPGDSLIDPNTDNYVVTAALGTDERLLRADGTGAKIQSSPLGCTDAGVVTGVTGFDGSSIVFNDSGAARNFRFEGDTSTNLFEVIGVGGTDQVAIGSGATSGNIARFGPNQVIINELGGAISFKVSGDNASQLLIVEDDEVLIGTGSSGTLANISPSGIFFNSGEADIDFNVRGNTASFLLTCNAGLDAVLIGTVLEGAIADFRAAGIVFNEFGQDRDFRVESDDLQYAFFLDGNENNIALIGASAAPNWQSMVGGIFLGNATTAPTAVPSGGVFIYASSTTLFALSASGDGTPTQIAPAIPQPQIDSFQSSGTWAKPAGAVKVGVHLIGGGGGGGSGRRGATGTVRGGGGGGGGGGYSFQLFNASELDSTEDVTIGAAGTGGADITTDNMDGGAGGNGGTTEFDTIAGSLTAPGGSGGAGGTTSGGAGGSGGAGNTQTGGAGGTGAGTSAATGGGSVTGVRMAGGGGGGGGSINGSIVVSSATGGNSAGSFGQRGVEQKVNFGGTAKTLPAVGFAGYPGVGIVDGALVAALGGGGGGGASATESADTSDSYIIQGGTGARYGAGGGAAPGRTNGLPGFFGGAFGGPGFCVVITYFAADQVGAGSGV